MEEKMEECPLSMKRYDVVIVLLIIVFASCDLFRGYLDSSIINAFFSLKELLLVSLFVLYANKIGLCVNRSFLFVSILFLTYCSLNTRSIDETFLFFIYLKYLIVYYLCYVIFVNTRKEILQKAANILLAIFFFYSLFSIFQLTIYPDSLVRSGRMSGFANPSYLSYIYLLCFLFAYKQRSFYMGIWFIIVGFLTLTKTFFVVFLLVLIYLVIYSSKRFKLLSIILILSPCMYYVVQQNQDVFITFNRAITVLTDSESGEYNSLEDRFSKISDFKKNNDGTFIWGYGTGKAGPATIFASEKMNKDFPHTVDFENQFLNIYFSLGFLGLLLFYYPFYNKAKYLLFNRNFKNKHIIRLFFLVFLLYNMTLNILESFTACIISLLFLILYEKEY